MNLEKLRNSPLMVIRLKMISPQLVKVRPFSL